MNLSQFHLSRDTSGENGRTGVRNHVLILPVDDLSNAAAQAVANNIKGTMAMPHPYGRLQFGADLDLHFRTLIGTGANPNVAAVVVICIEERLGQEGGRWHRRDRQAGRRISASSSTATTTPSCAHPRPRRNSCSGPRELRREERPLKDLWVSTKCGESDTTSGCGANPTVGNAFDKLYPHGVTLVLRRDHRAHRRRAPRRRALPQRRSAQEVPVHVRPLPAGRRAAQDERPDRTPSRPRAISTADSRRSRKKRSATSRRSAASAWSTACSTRPRRRPGRACGSWIRRRRRPRW